MEIIKYLPVTPNERDFLVYAMNFYKHMEMAAKIKIKIEKMKEEEVISPSDIISRICLITGITTDDIRSEKRNRHISESRSCASYLIHFFHPNLTLKAVGKYTNKDHSTVLHHYKTVESVKEVRELYEKLRREI